MDDIIKDVNEGWDEDGQRTQFRGSDDYLRQKASEILASSSDSYLSFQNSSKSMYLEPLRLSSMRTSLRRVKETMWLSPKVSQICASIVDHGSESQIPPYGAGDESNSIQDYNPLWISELRRTNAYEVWERVTDPLLFDIAEPR